MDIEKYRDEYKIRHSSKTKFIQARVTAELKKEIVRYAEKRNMSISECLEFMILNSLEAKS
jgi:antitoxin component of RelBE/YafQ-DinJ toxin-antitoxin module